MNPLMLLLAGVLLAVSLLAPDVADALVLPSLGVILLYVIYPTDAEGGPAKRSKLGIVDWLVVLAVFISCVAAPIGYAVLLDRIQDERANGTRENCEATNKRNRDTKAEVPALPTGAPRESTEAHRITFLIIDRALPVQNCDKLVKQRVKAGRS